MNTPLPPDFTCLGLRVYLSHRCLAMLCRGYLEKQPFDLDERFKKVLSTLQLLLIVFFLFLKNFLSFQYAVSSVALHIEELKRSMWGVTCVNRLPGGGLAASLESEIPYLQLSDGPLETGFITEAVTPWGAGGLRKRTCVGVRSLVSYRRRAERVNQPVFPQLLRIYDTEMAAVFDSSQRRRRVSGSRPVWRWPPCLLSPGILSFPSFHP